MPDIELRFHNEMLVLSAPIDATLTRQGIDVALDRQYLNLMEPDVVRDALKLEQTAGAHCLVTSTENITNARLSHVHMQDNGPALAKASLRLTNELKPQHVLVEIGPCGLPLDASSKASLNENRAQYADAARAFGEGANGGEGFDAFFLNGFTSLSDLKCALMGVSQVSAKPIFASVLLGDPDAPGQREDHDGQSAPGEQAASGGKGAPGEQAAAGGQGAPGEHAASGGQAPSEGAEGARRFESLYPGTTFRGYADIEPSIAPPTPSAHATALDPDCWAEAVDIMVEFGAAVVGFETAEPLDKAIAYAKEAAARCSLPLLAQLRVDGQLPNKKTRSLVPLEDRTDYEPDTMERAAVKLYSCGVQFLRATGQATPAYTGALAATVMGLDVRPR